MGANDTAALLLGLEGVEVERVGPGPGGVRLVYAVAAASVVPTCPGCGRPSTRHEGQVAAAPGDLRCFGARIRLLWRKRRWRCDTPGCPRKSFTETVPGVRPRSRLAARLRRSAGEAVADGGRTVAEPAYDHGLSWPVAHGAFTAYAAEVLPAALAPVEVPGIDETRRGRPRYKADPDTGELAQVADRWHVGFTDLSGGQGLLGQAEGRRAASARQWLERQPPPWREGVRHVAIDMCGIFAAAVRTHPPNARIVVDCFHIVQLAGKRLAELRRRLARKTRGRRGRRGDPEWDLRGLLSRHKEDLTPERLDALRRELPGIGTYGKQVYDAWRAKELLRDLLRLTFKHSHATPDRSAISQARYAFLSFCAGRAYLPELVTLAETAEKWRDGIEAYTTTGITNAATGGRTGSSSSTGANPPATATRRTSACAPAPQAPARTAAPPPPGGRTGAPPAPPPPGRASRR